MRFQNWVGLYNTLSMVCTCHAMSSVYAVDLHYTRRIARTKNLGRETIVSTLPGELRGESPYPTRTCTQIM